MEEQKRRKVGCCVTLLIILLLVASLIMGLAAYGYNSVLGKINRVDGTEETLSQAEIDAIENETDPWDEEIGRAHV